MARHPELRDPARPVRRSASGIIGGGLVDDYRRFMKVEMDQTSTIHKVVVRPAETQISPATIFPNPNPQICYLSVNPSEGFTNSCDRGERLAWSLACPRKRRNTPAPAPDCSRTSWARLANRPPPRAPLIGSCTPLLQRPGSPLRPGWPPVRRRLTTVSSACRGSPRPRALRPSRRERAPRPAPARRPPCGRAGWGPSRSCGCRSATHKV